MNTSDQTEIRKSLPSAELVPVEIAQHVLSDIRWKYREYGFSFELEPVCEVEGFQKLRSDLPWDELRRYVVERKRRYRGLKVAQRKYDMKRSRPRRRKSSLKSRMRG